MNKNILNSTCKVDSTDLSVKARSIYFPEFTKGVAINNKSKHH